MRSLRFASVLLFLLAACASGGSSDNVPVEMQLSGANLSGSTLYFPGPVPLNFTLAVRNTGTEPITLQSLDLRNIGPGAFGLRSGSVPVNRTIAPGATETLTLSTWGYSRGGYLSAQEPVTVRAVGTFHTPSGKTFLKLINENLVPD